MATLILILLIAAFILLVMAAFGIGLGSVSPGWLGLAFVVLVMLLGGGGLNL